jgi:hypothetical protein
MSKDSIPFFVEIFFCALGIILAYLLIYISIVSARISKHINTNIEKKQISKVDADSLNNYKVIANIISIQERKLETLVTLGKSILTTISVCFVSIFLFWGITEVLGGGKGKTESPKSVRDTVNVYKNININNNQNYRSASGCKKQVNKNCTTKESPTTKNCCNAIIDSIHSATNVIIQDINKNCK